MNLISLIKNAKAQDTSMMWIIIAIVVGILGLLILFLLFGKATGVTKSILQVFGR